LNLSEGGCSVCFRELSTFLNIILSDLSISLLPAR
jgi:hypothetical protein